MRYYFLANNIKEILIRIVSQRSALIIIFKMMLRNMKMPLYPWFAGLSITFHAKICSVYANIPKVKFSI